MQTIERVTIVPTGAALGAEVRGINLASPLDDETFSAIDGALSRHGMLFIRKQDITVEQQIAFVRRFGEAAPNVNQQAAFLATRRCWSSPT